MTLNELTVAQAHEKLRSKEISAVELTKACLERIDAVDGSLNAVVYNDGERALEAAKNIDAQGTFDHPLAGIPYMTKDVYCESGVPTTACSNILRDKDYVPPFDSTTTARLKARGAISLGKANTDEFTMGASCETSCYGPCRNPWDTSRVSGGSSGGSAASVGADECLFSLGTDTGGSIRQPAGFCSCTGLRVTYGRTSRYGVMSMASSLDSIGPICKTVEDTALVLETIAGKDPKDVTTADVPVGRYFGDLSADLKGVTLGVPKEYFIDGMDSRVEQAVRDAIAKLEELGATVKDVSLPHTKYAVATYYVIAPSEVSSNMARYDGIRFGREAKDSEDLIDHYFKVRTEGFGDEVKRRIMIGTYALSAGYYDAYYRQAQKVRALIKQDFDEAFNEVDAIVAPVSPGVAFEVGAHEGDPVAMYLEDVFLSSQPLAGIPALSVQCGFNDDNMPIGLQIMAGQWQEQTVLNVGHAYQKATDWHLRRPEKIQ